jgi:hypothetical protein
LPNAQRGVWRNGGVISRDKYFAIFALQYRVENVPEAATVAKPQNVRQHPENCPVK